MDIEYDSTTDLEKAANRICPHCDSLNVALTGKFDAYYTSVSLYFMCGDCEETWRVAYNLEPSFLYLDED